jgi:hypothetical protein
MRTELAAHEKEVGAEDGVVIESRTFYGDAFKGRTEP